jgi:Amt family ammonium transporter
MGADDALDIFAVHAVGGFVGELLTGLFAADYIVHLDGVTVIKGGWVNGNWVQLGIQLAVAVSTLAWSFVFTYFILICMLLLGKFVPALRLRVDKDQEEQGVDDIEIGEFAYDYVERNREVNPAVNETDAQDLPGVLNLSGADIAPSEKEESVYPTEIIRPSSTADVISNHVVA